MSLFLSRALVASLRADAASFGFARLGVAHLDDPRLAHSRRALDRYASEGRAGEMDFMTKTIPLRQHPEQLLPEARTAIVGLVAYDGEPSIVARYAQFFDYHTDVHRRMLAVAGALEREVPGITTLVCVDTKPVPERALAMIAGLGFIGKNGCLIAPGLGSFVVIGVLLTDAALADDVMDEGPRVDGSEGGRATPPETRDGQGTRGALATPDDVPWDACGRCRACLDACPTEAFDAPGVLDPRRCISYLTIEHRGPVPDGLLAGIGERVAGCDVCQDVCPYNKGAASRLPLTPVHGSDVVGRAGTAAAAAKLRRHEDGRSMPTSAQLATIRNRRYKAFIKQSPVDRIPRRTMHRNALIALGNRGGRLDDEERRALVWHLLGSDDGMFALAARAWHRREGEAPPDKAELASRFPDVADAHRSLADEPVS
jgi:epoxyqueuosine reductase